MVSGMCGFNSFQERRSTACDLSRKGATSSGTYRSQYGAEPLQGTVHGNVVQIQTNIRYEGQGVGYRFEGIINGDEIQGDLDLGEY